MKKSFYLSLFFLSALLTSCGDTNVVENIPDGSLDTPPISGYFKKRVLTLFCLIRQLLLKIKKIFFPVFVATKNLSNSPALCSKKMAI